MNGLGDCWVEFRANVKRPLGFMKKRLNANMSMNNSQMNSRVRSGNDDRIQRVAKAPNLPYE
eukprot:CAMPEP_0197258448 /NCGR_PEP_ID=MMETSP1429-20130617/82104_1 /TAXON_ID=49237 /ORGANISM="Chaetoceros  sp., Strain UNC1202" /LENGTH=61 /DNA_ID=CAMNT_0042722557 /DNA_START=38 /DNA_END=223 /DNA_ORIENTATION=+